MTKREGKPIAKRGERIVVYPEWPGVIAAIRWNRYMGYTYGIRRDDDKRIYYVSETQIAEALWSEQPLAITARSRPLPMDGADFHVFGEQ